MGNGGSYTSKATINPHFFVFTRWEAPEMAEFLQRGQQELSETFALRRHEFDFLVGHELVDFPTSRALFNEIFDTDGNSLVDKFEVMTVICLVSKLSNKEKIQFFFDLFNFNNKGYLYESELVLLFYAISRGVFKADQKYIPPSNKSIAHLVEEAKLHMVYSKGSMRKPELVKFILGNRDVLSFLESWRGHAAQVLLGESKKWRDLTFPAAAVSIAPSYEWLKVGLPPENFIRWRRRDKVGNELGCLQMFTHAESFFKTVDRRAVYKGPGVIGQGTLKQGMLADRWFLNALAAIIARPEAVMACLATTGQEESGRYCTRFYEGGGWRSVNVDDRIPCSPDCNPLFSVSSHSLEAWPLILEKGLAKYLGSYGRLGMCGQRGDATMTGLRLVTGGHVQQLSTQDFHWTSVEIEVPEGRESGAAFVKKCMAQGSFVSLGRSESMVLMSRRPPATTLRATEDDPTGGEAEGGVSNATKYQLMLPPCGRLFPVVGHVFIKNYLYIILRDAFGLIDDCDPGVNFETGHCRTFMIKVEDIPKSYDIVMVSRFPDSLRPLADKLQFQPWYTEFDCQDTGGVQAPAAFRLTVRRGDPESALVANPLRRMGNRAANITAVLYASDGKAPTELEKLMRLRPKVDFSREKTEMRKRKLKLEMRANVKEKEEGKKSDKDAKAAAAGGKKTEADDDEDFTFGRVKGPKYEEPEELVEVCFTVSRYRFLQFRFRHCCIWKMLPHKFFLTD